MNQIEFLRKSIRERIDSDPTLVGLDELLKHDYIRYIEREVKLEEPLVGRGKSAIRAVINQMKHEISPWRKR